VIEALDITSSGPQPAGEVAGWMVRALELATECPDDAARIDLLAAFESMKAVCAGGQAKVTVAFAATQTAQGQARGTKPELIRRSVAGQVALARRDAPHRGGRHIGLAAALHTELPHTRQALEQGRISEWQATLICRETACLDPDLRILADERLAPDLGAVGDRMLEATAARIVAELDAAAVADRSRKAAGDRRVTVRPAPDTMAYLTALLPASVAVAAYAALTSYTQLVIGEGDERGRGMGMADTLVDRLTGGAITGCDVHGVPIHAPNPDDQQAGDEATDAQAADQAADDTAPATSAGEPAERYHYPTAAEARAKLAKALPTAANIHLHVIMTDRTLFGVCDEPAELIGHGPIPAEVARALAAADLGPKAATWIRRFYTDPATGALAATESKARRFPTVMREFLLVRDRACRTPFCPAPGRHHDHQHDHAQGGPTSQGNGQLTCESCNHTKQAPGWSVSTRADGVIETTTPTGHRYQSPPPVPPGVDHHHPPGRIETVTEQRLHGLILEYHAA
jgi:hypothetical protein